MTRSYKDLIVYQKSYELALEIHKITLTFPAFEKYELGSQLRRSAVSIPLNIAEGYGRKSYSKHFTQFLTNALGSSNETAVLLHLSMDLGYITKEKYNELSEKYDHLGRQINRLIQVNQEKESNI
jgi:four helix bundle protein